MKLCKRTALLRGVCAARVHSGAFVPFWLIFILFIFFLLVFSNRGRRPRHLLAGEALADEAAPQSGPAAKSEAPAVDRDAQKALKKLKKEQK